MHFVATSNSLSCFGILLYKCFESYDAQDFKGNTPLIQAVKNQNLKLVEYLLDMGAKLEIKDKA